MTNEEKRSCYTCFFQSLCHPKNLVQDAVTRQAGWMFESSPDAMVMWTDVFDTLAQACNQYTKMKGAEK